MALYYIAHRLFAAHDRALGAYLASRLARDTGAGSVFLPFCDTDEENLLADCKGHLLFQLDCARLQRITGMIAVLHGPSLDDGVCMEAGFAAASGVPVVLMSTDFQAYAPSHGGPRLSFPDPIFEHVAASVIRAHRIGASRAPTGQDRYRAFLEQNMAPVIEASDQAVKALLRLTRDQAAASRRGPQRTDLAYVEPSPYLDDPAWDAISGELRSRGWQVHVGRRLQPGADPAGATRADWAAATTASLAVIDARGPETPPGAALVTGACLATGCPVLAAHHGTWHTLADGREPNWRNLMIQYALAGRFSGTAEFTSALDALPCTPR